MNKYYLDRYYDHQKKFDAQDKACTLSLPITMISEHIANHRKKQIVQLDANLTEIDVLFALNSFKKDVSAVEISNALLFSSGGISKVLKKLENKGYISRRVSSMDKRSTLIHLEKSGKKIIMSSEPLFHKQDNEIFSALNEREKEELKKMLKKVLYSITDK